MKQYAIKRLLISIPLVFVMTFVVFVVINWSGSTKFDTFENDAATDPQIIELEKRRLGIYDPIPHRYFNWLRGVLFDIRLSSERRYIATFEDNDPQKGEDKYKFGGTEIREPLDAVAGSYDVGGKEGSLVSGFGTSGEIQQRFNPKMYEQVVFGADVSPKGLALVIVSGSGEVVFPFTAKDGAGTLRLTLDELVRKAAPENIRKVTIDAEAPGKTTLKAEAIRRRIWQETYPGRYKRRAIQVTYVGREGQFAELGRLKSPYTVKTKAVEGTDWDVDWNVAQAASDQELEKTKAKWVEDGRKGPEPERLVLERVSFDVLEFEAHSLTGSDLKVEVQLLTGTPPAVVPVKLGEVTLSPSDQTFTMPLHGTAEKIDLRHVQGMRLVCSTAGGAEFDEFRLRLAGSPFRAGAPNFGQSWDKKQGVVSLISEKVRNTIMLNVWAIFFTWLIALPAGIYGAVRQYTTGDKVLSFMTFVGMAMPSFFLATLIVFLIALLNDIPQNSMWSFLRGVLPISGRTSAEYTAMSTWGQMRDVAWHMIAPITVGVLASIGGLQRIVRGTMLEERRKLYVTTAMAKGLPPFKVLFKHALRNAIIPFVASLGSLLPGLIGGSAFVEIVFDYPGIGKQMLESVQSNDIPVVMANTLIVGLLLVVGNLLADILLGFVDPRISVEG